MSAFAQGFALGARRMRDTRLGAGALSALLLVALAGRLERLEGPAGAADRTLAGAAFGIAVPLMVYAFLSRALAAGRLSDSVLVLGRHGADRRAAAAGLLASVAMASAVAGVLVASLAVFAARGASDPALASDIATSLGIGLMAGIGYACWLGLGSAVGPSGGGRFWALGLDWLLGAGTTALAATWPRSHIRNLLGAEPVLALPQWSSAAALALVASSCLLLACLRTPR